MTQFAVALQLRGWRHRVRCATGVRLCYCACLKITWHENQYSYTTTLKSSVLLWAAPFWKSQYETFLGGRVALHQHWRYLSLKESSWIVNCSPSISDARSMLNDKHLWSGLNVGRAACSEVEVEPGTKIRLLLFSFLTLQSPFPWSTCRCSCGKSSQGQWSNRESRSHPFLQW